MKPERHYQGIAVAPGIAQGIIVRHLSQEEKIPVREITEEEVPREIKRFEEARRATQNDILAIRKKMAQSVGANDASLFDAHLLLLEDPGLLKEVHHSLKKDRFNIEHVFNSVVKQSCNNFKKIENAYIRERTVDIEDVSGRILNHLLGKSRRRAYTSDRHHIIVAHTLTPSDAAMLHHEPVVAFATETGSKTSHTAIIARALGIPAIVGLHNIVAMLHDGDAVLLDGYHGLLIVNPTFETVQRYNKMQLEQKKIEQELEHLRDTSAETQDGRHIILSANIELPEEVDATVASGAEGIGLYRTEFLYLNRTTAPDEEEQYKVFSSIAERMKPHGAIIRTFDGGADKPFVTLPFPKEANPFLGCRGIRFCLQHKEFFKVQLRAILRAAVTGNLRMMYPMISGIEELREAHAILEEAKEELRNRRVPFYEDLEVGMMIEVPGAAMIADLLAGEVKFFSIGTNDLIQYVLSVDRGNDAVAYLYNPAHPAVIRILKNIIDAAHAAGIWVGLCGELAGDLLFTPLLVGLGIDELSVSAPLVPRIKKAIQSLELSPCHELVASTINNSSAVKNYAQCVALAQQHYGFLL